MKQNSHYPSKTMKLNQVTVLAAAALLIPIGGTLASLNTHQATAASNPFESVVVAQESAPSARQFAKHHGGGRRHKGKRLLEDLKAIGVDEARLAKAEEIMKDCREKSQEMRQELREERQKMRDLYASDASNDELREQFEVLQEMRMKLKQMRFDCKLQIRDLLTVEERQQLLELRQQRRSQRRGRRGRRF